ncbi:dihydrolipoyl dehydrogenase [Paenibacillus yanchengensis]|uniref:Dihydrolipoyl dehydrogenase n=1 Tax=Paenibacillus yanchengensis TaxID=2035833 RepID=A0ABW4YK54_9BACL
MTIEADIAILGGGPGGYTAAIRAAQLGKKVVIVEQNKLGGTCLHRGCIPSKSLLRSAEVYQLLQAADQYGIAVSTENVSVQFDQVQLRKQKTVDELHIGLQYLMKKNGIQLVEGKARLIGPSIFSPRTDSLAVELVNGEMETVQFGQLIIATGAKPKTIPNLNIDKSYVWTSDEALQMEQLPASMIIIGGGVIGVEWASMLQDFGVQVTIVEAADQLLPGEDRDSAAELTKQLEQRGVRILTSTEIAAESYRVEANAVVIEAQSEHKSIVLQADKLMIAIGRAPIVHGLGLENTDVTYSDKGIVVNSFGQTSEPHIYAIGDCIGTIQLAHAASRMGIIAVEHMLEQKPQEFTTKHIPRCIYSKPEIASIGLTEKQAKEQHQQIKIGKIPFQAIGKAHVIGDTGGFVKVIADVATNDILGVHIVGPQATDLIGEAALAGWLNATPWEVGQLAHAHPSLSEAIYEAMLAVDGQSFSF